MYYRNVLIELGLKEKYILLNNHKYFGYKDITEQNRINSIIDNIINEFNNKITKFARKYNIKSLLFELCELYSKLNKIHLTNNEILKINKDINQEILNEISYTAKAADLMSRKIKNVIEEIIVLNNIKGKNKVSKSDYKKITILLYYYSIFTFYSSKNKLIKNLMGSVTNIYIYPSELDSICTTIENLNNSTNKNQLFYNYDSGFKKIINQEFNNAFYFEKGILYTDYKRLMQSLIDIINKGDKKTIFINKDKLLKEIKRLFIKVDIAKFEKECLITKEILENYKDSLYKNNYKYRLDTTPIICLEDNYCILNKNIIWNSKNFWDNVHSIGIIPYTNNNGKIIKATEKIIDIISKSFEKDIVKTIKELDNNIRFYRNKKTKDIFPKKKIDDNEWDIIAVDDNLRKIYVIEAKYLTTSITESGLVNGLNRFTKNNGYIDKFNKRIDIVDNYKKDFLNYCVADETYSIVNIMITSKVVDLNIKSNDRDFYIIHFNYLKEFLEKLK